MSGTPSLAFFDEFHRFSSAIETSVNSSLSGCKSIKEAAATSRAQLYAPAKVDEATRARQNEKQTQVWQTLIGNAEKLKEEVTQLLAALNVNASSITDPNNKPASSLPLSTHYASFSNQLASMQQQSASLRQSLADQEESRASLLSARRSSLAARKSAREAAQAEANIAKEASAVVPTALVAGDEENSPQLSNKVAPSAVPSVSKHSMSPAATKPKRKSVLPSARLASPLKAVAVPPVSKISPAKLAQVMRRQSLEARKAAEAQQQAELEAARAAAEAEAENAAEQSAVMEDVMEEKTAEVITAQTTLDTSILASPQPATQTSMIASPSPVAAASAATPSTPAAKQTLVGLSDDLLDSPATPDFVGKLSEATRRMLDAHAGASTSVTSASSSIPAGTSSVAPRSAVSGTSSSIPILSRPAMPLVDSPATPELATVALAKETRAAKKAGLINTPATGRKMSLGGGRESLGGNALPSYPSSQTARTPAPVTPARNLFHSVATPMSVRVRGINARQSGIGLATPSANIAASASSVAPTTPAASSSSSSTAAPEILPPVHYSMLAPAAPGAGLDDSNLMSNSMSMSDSLLATPELASRKSVAGAVAWVSGAESAKKKSKPVLGSTPPKATSVTSPSAAPVTTPRSTRKGILKTPKSSVRKSSRIAEKTPTSAVKGLTPSNSDPTLATTAAGPGTPASPMLGSILSSLSESFSMPSPAPAAAPTMKETPASAAKRRAASAK